MTRAKSSSHALCSTLAVSLLACLACATQAHAVPSTSGTAAGAQASPLAPATRYDVRTLCPGVDAALQSALQAAWWQHRLAATLQVQMRLQGDEIAAVRIVDGPHAYASAVKRAVRNLTCDAGAAAAQTVRFDVTFSDQGDSNGSLAMGSAEPHLR